LESRIAEIASRRWNLVERQLGDEVASVVIESTRKTVFSVFSFVEKSPLEAKIEGSNFNVEA